MAVTRAITRIQDADDYTGTASNGKVLGHNGTAWTPVDQTAALAATGSGAPATTPSDGSLYIDTAAAALYGRISSAWSPLNVGISYASGMYYPAAECTATASTADSVQNRIRSLPFLIHRKVTLSHIACNVSTIGESGCKVRLGIYADSGAGVPGALIIDAGQVDADVLGIRDAACSITLLPGCYWFASVSQSCPTTRPTLTTYSALITARFGHSAGTFNNSSYLADSVSGALPGTFPTITRGNSATPAVLMKIA